MKVLQLIATSTVVMMLAIASSSVATTIEGCTTATNGQVFITIGGAVTGFNPSCVEIASGDTIEWTNADVGPASAHNPATLDVDRSCFSTLGDTGSTLDSLETYALVFTWDGTDLTSTSVAGGNVCSESNPDTYDVVSGNALIPYECTIHTNMDGIIVVTPA